MPGASTAPPPDSQIRACVSRRCDGVFIKRRNLEASKSERVCVRACKREREIKNIALVYRIHKMKESSESRESTALYKHNVCVRVSAMYGKSVSMYFIVKK